MKGEGFGGHAQTVQKNMLQKEPRFGGTSKLRPIQVGSQLVVNNIGNNYIR